VERAELLWSAPGGTLPRYATRWYPPTVAMSLLCTPSTVCQSPSISMIATSLAYAYFLETVVGRSEM